MKAVDPQGKAQHQKKNETRDAAILSKWFGRQSSICMKKGVRQVVAGK